MSTPDASAHSPTSSNGPGIPAAPSHVTEVTHPLPAAAPRPSEDRIRTTDSEAQSSPSLSPASESSGPKADPAPTVRDIAKSSTPSVEDQLAEVENKFRSDLHKEIQGPNGVSGNAAKAFGERLHKVVEHQLQQNASNGHSSPASESSGPKADPAPTVRDIAKDNHLSDEALAKNKVFGHASFDPEKLADVTRRYGSSLEDVTKAITPSAVKELTQVVDETAAIVQKGLLPAALMQRTAEMVKNGGTTKVQLGPPPPSSEVSQAIGVLLSGHPNHTFSIDGKEYTQDSYHKEHLSQKNPPASPADMAQHIADEIASGKSFYMQAQRSSAAAAAAILASEPADNNDVFSASKNTVSMDNGKPLDRVDIMRNQVLGTLGQHLTLGEGEGFDDSVKLGLAHIVKNFSDPQGLRNPEALARDVRLMDGPERDGLIKSFDAAHTQAQSSYAYVATNDQVLDIHSQYAMAAYTLQKTQNNASSHECLDKILHGLTHVGLSAHIYTKSIEWAQKPADTAANETADDTVGFEIRGTARPNSTNEVDSMSDGENHKQASIEPDQQAIRDPGQAMMNLLHESMSAIPGGIPQSQSDEGMAHAAITLVSPPALLERAVDTVSSVDESKAGAPSIICLPHVASGRDQDVPSVTAEHLCSTSGGDARLETGIGTDGVVERASPEAPERLQEIAKDAVFEILSHLSSVPSYVREQDVDPFSDSFVLIPDDSSGSTPLIAVTGIKTEQLSAQDLALDRLFDQIASGEGWRNEEMTSLPDPDAPIVAERTMHLSSYFNSFFPDEEIGFMTCDAAARQENKVTRWLRGKDASSLLGDAHTPYEREPSLTKGEAALVTRSIAATAQVTNSGRWEVLCDPDGGDASQVNQDALSMVAFMKAFDAVIPEDKQTFSAFRGLLGELTTDTSGPNPYLGITERLSEDVLQHLYDKPM